MYSELGAATTNVHIRVSRHATIDAPGWIPNPRSTNSGEIWHVDAHWPSETKFCFGGRAEGGIPPPQKKMPGINVGQLGSCAAPGTHSLRHRLTQTVGVCRTDRRWRGPRHSSGVHGDGDRCVAPMPSVTHLGHWPTTMPPLCRRRRRAIKARRRRRRLRSHTPPAVSRIQTRPPTTSGHHATPRFHPHPPRFGGRSVAEWLACCSWTQAQKCPGSNRAVTTLSANSLRQTVHTHRASVHQAAKLVAAVLRVAWVTAGLAESNGSLTPGL